MFELILIVNENFLWCFGRWLTARKIFIYIIFIFRRIESIIIISYLYDILWNSSTLFVIIKFWRQRSRHFSFMKIRWWLLFTRHFLNLWGQKFILLWLFICVNHISLVRGTKKAWVTFRKITGRFIGYWCCFLTACWTFFNFIVSSIGFSFSKVHICVDRCFLFWWTCLHFGNSLTFSSQW